MKKSLLKCGALCLFASVILAACGSSSGTSSSTEKAASGDDTVLEFYHGYHGSVAKF